MVATLEINAPNIAYRRQARRLRAMYSHSPAKLQRALSDLASTTDSAPPPVVQPTIQPTSDVQRFAAAVAQSLDGPVLRYSNRQRLIEQAATLGIRRFDANLLIAAVQHRLQTDGNPIVRSIMPPSPSSTRASWLLPACVIVLLQMSICVAAYLLLHS